MLAIGRGPSWACQRQHLNLASLQLSDWILKAHILREGNQAEEIYFLSPSLGRLIAPITADFVVGNESLSQVLAGVPACNPSSSGG
jgi:hypothetical protein